MNTVPARAANQNRLPDSAEGGPSALFQMPPSRRRIVNRSWLVDMTLFDAAGASSSDSVVVGVRDSVSTRAHEMGSIASPHQANGAIRLCSSQFATGVDARLRK